MATPDDDESTTPAPTSGPFFAARIDVVTADAATPALVRQAIAVNTHRISLPATGGVCDMLELLPPQLAATYADPAQVLRAPGVPLPRGVRPPRPAWGLDDSAEAYAQFVIHLHERDLLDFGDVAELTFYRSTRTRRGVTRRSGPPSREVVSVPIENGVFAVPKDDVSDRLIADLRPGNLGLLPPAAPNLPHPGSMWADVQAALAQLPLDSAGRGASVAKCDLKDFYHQIRIPPFLRRFTGLRRLDEETARAINDALGREVCKAGTYPRFCTLPMGLSHAVTVAQAIHLHQLQQVLDAAPETLRPTLSRVYIDDLVAIMVGRHHKARLRRFQDLYRAHMARIGLRENEKKRVLPRSSAPVIGLDLTFDRGRRDQVVTDSSASRDYALSATYAASPSTVLQLRQRIIDIIGAEPDPDKVCTSESAPRASSRDMQRLLGSIAWVFLVRRPLFCILERVYAWVHAGDHLPDHELRPLNDGCVQELRTVCDLLPLASASLPWRFASAITDASKRGGGAGVSSWVPPLRSGAQLLRQPQQQGCSPTPAAAPSVPDSAWSSFGWQWEARERADHINSLELSAAVTGIVRSHRIRGHRRFDGHLRRSTVLFTDNTATLHGIAKGRSSQRTTNRKLRLLTAFLLRHNAEVEGPYYVKSEDNVSDEWSRVASTADTVLLPRAPRKATTNHAAPGRART